VIKKTTPSHHRSASLLSSSFVSSLVLSLIPSRRPGGPFGNHQDIVVKNMDILLHGVRRCPEFGRKPTGDGPETKTNLSGPSARANLESVLVRSRCWSAAQIGPKPAPKARPGEWKLKLALRSTNLTKTVEEGRQTTENNRNSRTPRNDPSRSCHKNNRTLETNVRVQMEPLTLFSSFEFPLTWPGCCGRFWADLGREPTVDGPETGPKLSGPSARTIWDRFCARSPQVYGQNPPKTGPKSLAM
jgi:hypothetical protein